MAVLRFEAAMILRRKSLWLATALVCFVYSAMPSVSRLLSAAAVLPRDGTWRLAGQLVFQFNMFMALTAGLIAADCLADERRTGVSELLRSAPLRRWPSLLAKYCAALLSLLAPYLLWVVLFGAAVVALRLAPPVFLPALLAAFAAIALPAYAFVIAFSLAVPLVLPLRVYQVLFTGYWFWGNYLDPRVIPTPSGTLFTPSGLLAFEAFFGGFRGPHHARLHTPAEAWLNLAILALAVAAVLVLVERGLAWRDRHA
jgi:ABC-2 type transport system permease protein